MQKTVILVCSLFENNEELWYSLVIVLGKE